MKIEGIEKTSAALNALDAKVAKSITRKGLRQGAKVVLNAARSEAPERSGATKRNIKIRGGGGKKGTISLTVGVGAKDFAGQAFYASFVLYGHYVGSRKLGNARQFVPPNNFLERAYEETKEDAVTTTIDAWKNLLEEEGSK